MEVGQSVKVKEGILCPDAEEYDLSGWSGRITDITLDEDDNTLIGIKWDSITLKAIPEDYIISSDNEGLNWSEMYLFPSEVELTDRRDTDEESHKIKDEIENDVLWYGNPYLSKIISGVPSEDLEKWWEQYLTDHLVFPFFTIVDEFQERGPIKEGDKLKVFSIEMYDDLHGIIVNCRKFRKKYAFPLVDLAVENKESENYHLVEAYRIWFSNR